MNTSVHTRSAFLTAGISQMFLSTLAFALANVFVKEVSHIPVMEVVFFRCAVAAVLCGIGLRGAKGPILGNNKKLLLLRGVIGTFALALFFLTIHKIPLATAMTIQYLSPIFTSLFAIFYLKERVMGIQWVFYSIAFTGVVLIGQVDARVSFLFAALGIISAAGSGAAYNIVRRLRNVENPLTIILYFQLVGMAAGAVSLPFSWKAPEGGDWIYLLLVGVFSQLGQIFLTNAFSRERAASVAIIVYTGLVYGIVIGWLYYGEAQSLLSLLGMVLVVAGVASSVFYVRRQKTAEQIESTIA